MSSKETIDWSDVIKKEARGSDDFDLGEVQEVGNDFVLTQKGIVNKERFYVPKYLTEGYDGDTLYFNFPEGQARSEFLREAPPKSGEYARYKTADMPTEIEMRIPLIAERMEVSKRVRTDEATIVKEPVMETKTMDVPISHEEMRVERRQVTERESDEPVQTRTEIKVPLSHEELDVTKKAYVKEEVVISKNQVTETETVTEDLQSEKIDTSDIEKRRK